MINIGAIYICTESVFPSRRLQELIQKLEITKKYGINGDSVFVEHISTIVIIIYIFLINAITF